jgi:hypothetical protein
MKQRVSVGNKERCEASHTKKRYQRPKLQAYGKVQLLTQGQGGTMADGSSGMSMR